MTLRKQLETKIVENFEKVLGVSRISLSNGEEDVLCTVGLNELANIIGLKEFDRLTILVLNSVWERLSKVLSKDLGRKVYDKVNTSGCIEKGALGYNNLYLRFSSNTNLVNYSKCNFYIHCSILGHLGSDNNVYSEELFGRCIDGNRDEALFGTQQDLLKLLDSFSYDGYEKDEYTYVIKGVITLEKLRKAYPSATVLDFDALKSAIEEAQGTLIEDEELLEELPFGVNNDFGGKGSLVDFDLHYGNYDGKRALIIEATKELA